MKLLHLIGGETPEPRLMTPLFIQELKKLGDFEIVPGGNAMTEEQKAELIRGTDILVTGWYSAILPDSIAQDRGNLKYICNVTGQCNPWIKACHIDAGIPVTNWGDAPAQSVAEGAMALLLAGIKSLPGVRDEMEAGRWTENFGALKVASLEGLTVAIYGLGVIGQRFVEMLRPFQPLMRAYDPYLQDWPQDIQRVSSLEELAQGAAAFVIHAGLTPETRGSVSADILARLPDGALVVNTARGDIVDQEALFAELAAGRLRAALDVLSEPEKLPPDHPARRWPNLILTGHRVSSEYWPDKSGALMNYQRYALQNIQAFIEGRPLRFIMDAARFARSS